MAVTTRALAIAHRWFDPATAGTVFEPLIADWQREWQDASPSRRFWVSLRWLTAFVCAIVVSMPRVLTTRASKEITDRVATRVIRFVAVTGAILMIRPTWQLLERWNAGASWFRPELILFAVPGAMLLAFPFAMAGAVDIIRRHHAHPDHVARAAALKLAALSMTIMLIGSGWIAPAAHRASQDVMNPPGMGQPLRGMGELTTLELVTDPSRATAFAPDTVLAARSESLNRELNSRAVLTILPVVLLWLRWRAHNPPRHRLLRRVPAFIATVASIAAVIGCAAAGAWLEREGYMPIGATYWLPIALFAVWGIVAHQGADDELAVSEGA